MYRTKRTPETSKKEELLRKAITSELRIIGEEYGYGMVANILLNSPQRRVIQASRKWYVMGDGDIFRVLEKAGVFVERKGREFVITDGRGKFSFTDDFYYSGFNYLVKAISDFFKVPAEFLVASRNPSSLRKYIEQDGLWCDESPVKSARDWLVNLHKKGLYDSSKLYLRLQGGKFDEFRPIVFKQFQCEGPAATPYTKSAMGFKITEMCLDGSGFAEIWVQIRNVMRYKPAEVLIQAFRRVDKDVKSFIERRWKVYKRKFIDHNYGIDNFQRDLEVDYSELEQLVGDVDARKGVLGMFFTKHVEIIKKFPPDKLLE